MKTQLLRESVQQLREYMFSASSYPGPEPGKMFSLNGFATGMQNHPFDREPKDAEKKAKLKQKRDDKRVALRKMATWAQRQG